jgi:hypothetical protein
MEIKKEDLEAMRELADLCKRHRLTIYSHDGIYTQGVGSLVLSFGTSRHYRAKHFGANTNEVQVDATVAISAPQPKEEADG